MKNLLFKLLIIPPIAVGVMAFSWLVGKEPADLPAKPEAVVGVRAVALQRESFKAQISGFGRVEAEQTWSAIAEVEGRITELSASSNVGSVLAAGSRILEIDRRDYEIALSQAIAARNTALSDINELNVSETNYKNSLAVEKQILEVFAAERDRQAELVDRGGVAQAALDSANRSYLGQQSVVVNLEASLNLIAPQRAALQASLAMILPH